MPLQYHGKIPRLCVVAWNLKGGCFNLHFKLVCFTPPYIYGCNHPCAPTFFLIPFPIKSTFLREKFQPFPPCLTNPRPQTRLKIRR